MKKRKKERNLSPLQKEYRNFFLEKMALYGVKSPAELTKEEKSIFFTEIKIDWAKYKQDKQELKKILRREGEVVETESKARQRIPVNKWTEKQYEIQQLKDKKQVAIDKKESWQKEEKPLETTKQIVKSMPNQDQTDDLRILFNPNNYFTQKEDYHYPVVKMPKPNAILKLPRYGRSNKKGYKENDFFNHLKNNISNIELTNDVHMVIPNFDKPYEPDIVLFDKSINLFIDVEIDEPYDGYYRYPTHFIHPEEEVKQDNIRDLFFTESGWIVIRFTEKQVHCQTRECIDYITNVLHSIYNEDFSIETKCEKEVQWDYNQCIQWQKAVSIR